MVGEDAFGNCWSTPLIMGLLITIYVFLGVCAEQQKGTGCDGRIQHTSKPGLEYNIHETGRIWQVKHLLIKC